MAGIRACAPAKGRFALAMTCLLLALGSAALAEPAAVPERRFVLSEDTDLPGGDLATMLDATLESCERACLADDRCTAFTFNSKNGSCFPKAGAGDPVAYPGAYAGRVRATDPAVLAAAPARRAELTFLGDDDLAQARQQADDLANAHVTGSWTAAEHLQSAAEAEANGDYDGASQFTGAALNLTDAPEGWADYARLLLAAGQPDGENQRAFRDRALSASINAYLRSAAPAQRHTALAVMGQALESVDRGADTVKALRLAQAIQPRDDTAAALDDAIGKYGFRITENTVESDSARPRICATFSDDLVAKGTDYANYVQLADPGLTVTAGGWRQLCVEGVQHGSRYAVTFREGLPAADGQSLAKSVTITQYVRDRKPAARFPGRTYVLPRASGASIPVQTVNTKTLDLTLYAVSDRNMLRAIQDSYFGDPMQAYSEESFAGNVGEALWHGTADVAMEVNRDVTTRLPMGEAIAGRAPGIYALRATAPGTDPYDVAPAWQWFVVTDLGLTTISGVDGLHVFVRSLATAAAKPGAEVELLSRANAVLGHATTDAAGYARFDAGLARGTGGTAPALVTVRDGSDDLAFLSLADPEFDLSDRGVAGREAAPPVDVFLTTDRGAYRAGETVHATALARDSAAAATEGLPLTAILKRPDGLEYARAVADDAGAGGHVFTLPIAGAAPRGVWRLETYADLEADPLAATTFLVEDFLPERIDFALSLPDAPIRLGDVPALALDARYLFGAPGADLAIEGEVQVRAAAGLAAWPGYVFGRQDEPFTAQSVPLDADLRTDPAGQATIDVALPAIADPARPLEARFTLRVAEGSGRPVERELVRALEPSAPMIGIKPLVDGAVAENSDARFALIGIGPEAGPLPMKVKWELTRIETDYQWYQQYGQWQWEPVTTRTRVADGTADLGATPAEIAAPVQWGEFELLVERTDGPYAAASTTFSAGWSAPADTATTPDTLELSLDKPAYRPGDTAHLRLVPRAAGTALVTVLSNRLIAMKAVDVVAGENMVDLPVTDDWGAGVYVTVSALRPMNVAAGHKPARALGLAHAAIDPGARQLHAAIVTAPEAAPRGPLDVAVRVDGVAPARRPGSRSRRSIWAS